MGVLNKWGLWLPRTTFLLISAWSTAADLKPHSSDSYVHLFWVARSMKSRLVARPLSPPLAPVATSGPAATAACPLPLRDGQPPLGVMARTPSPSLSAASRVDLSGYSSGSESRSYVEVARGNATLAGAAGAEGASGSCSRPARVASIVVAPGPAALARVPASLRLGERVELVEEGWEHAEKKRRQCRFSPPLPSLPVRPEIPMELAGRCFNCLGSDHVAALCRNECRCRRCFEPGHMAKVCPNQRISPPPAYQACSPTRPRAPAASVVPAGAVPVGAAPTVPATAVLVAASVRQVGAGPVAAVEALPARVVVPGVVRAPPEALLRREACIIARSPALTAAEEALKWGAVVTVSGNRRRIAVSEMRGVICRACPVVEGHFSIHKFWPADFLCVFDSSAARDSVLAAGQVTGTGFSLRFGLWNRQLQERLRTLRFRVRLEMEGISAHAWDAGSAATMLGPVCWVERVGTDTALREDLGRFTVYAWTDDPSKIAREMTRGIPEPPPAELLEGADKLFLSLEDLIPNSVEILDYPIIIHLPCVEDRSV